MVILEICMGRTSCQAIVTTATSTFLSGLLAASSSRKKDSMTAPGRKRRPVPVPTRPGLSLIDDEQGDGGESLAEVQGASPIMPNLLLHRGRVSVEFSQGLRHVRLVNTVRW